MGAVEQSPIRINVALDSPEDWAPVRWWKGPGDQYDVQPSVTTRREACAPTISLASLSGQNGFFATVCVAPSRLVAAVDRIRSIPLFYAEAARQLFVSDDPYWIQERLGGPSLDTAAAVEFLLAGYVTGTQTLDSRVRQLQAGEALEVTREGAATAVVTHRYYRFVHEDPLETGEDELLERLDDATMRSMERLAHVAGGRQIAIALSGGLDSRLIAMSLKRLGYPNLLAYSYGLPGNAETAVSREVAAQLGIPWRFVEYSKEKWHALTQTEAWTQYTKLGEGMVSVAHLQDWPAVMEMTHTGMVAEDAVFCPGHSADFVAGSHLPPALVRKTGHCLEEVVRTIYGDHYCLGTLGFAQSIVPGGRQVSAAAVAARIRATLADLSAATADQAANAYEYWDWQERQAKFICNSLRVYEYFGHEWWTPFWDTEFTRFWQTVPLEFRIGKRLYDRYVLATQRSTGMPTSASDRKPVAHLPWMRSAARVTLSTLGLLEFSRRTRKIARSRHIGRTIDDHPLAWYGLSERPELQRLWAAGANVANINSVLAVRQVERAVS